MTNLDSILKSRDITLPTKVHLVKAMVFPVVMYGCESWTVKKAERWSIDAFELWCWKRLLRVPWTARRSNQSILKEISLGCSLEGLMLKLKLQYFGHLMRKVDSLEKTLILGGLGAGGKGDNRGWDGWMASPTRWMWVWVNSGVGDGQGGLACCDSWGRKESDTTERLNWTELKFGEPHYSVGMVLNFDRNSSKMLPISFVSHFLSLGLLNLSQVKLVIFSFITFPKMLCLENKQLCKWSPPFLFPPGKLKGDKL